MTELPPQYNPKETEDKWYAYWLEKNLFSAKANSKKKPFCIVIPPPNVTGILHMGHALNNTIQDILIRYHKMKGEETLWMPGTDHAGIATQNVVEKSIAKEGLRRQDLGREKFLERVWQWKEQYGSTIISQLKKLGASCDWERTRFTMDEDYSKSVVEVFVRLYEKGLIYRGSYIINWCPRCQTALSDEEAPYQEMQGKLYYLKYPLKKVTSYQLPVSQLKPANRQTGKQANYVVVATTRPETMLGDTAVAVNPKDKRYKKLIGQTLILPLVNREIKIIADETVDAKFGTGAVKVTPAHDPNDYQLGHKHNLEFINVMNSDGSMNENAGAYKGMDRFKAREVILKDLEERNLLEKVEPHQLSAGHCYRCHTIIEPYLSKQWFVKMKPLSKPALEAVKKGGIKFYPKRWTKVYLNWMENIKDWCISRQIWWGHRIPVYYCKKCQETGILKSKIKNQKSKVEEGMIVSRVKPDKCPICGSADIYQDEDVLDTWFSSWLWPFSTFGWPFETKKDLNYFYSTSVLVTAPEIIFFWVARMIMAGFEFMGKKPFSDVYIHGTVRDITGKKMSKSLGNIIDPLEIIQKYGTDALRFSLILLTSAGQDVFLSEEKFESGRNFANKIWNASRFILNNINLDKVCVDLCVYSKENVKDLKDKWILNRFYQMLQKTEKSLDKYRFNEALNSIYDFFWHEFCDWYIELSKQDLIEGSSKKEITQIILYKILEKTLRILHPFMPFITEEIWQKLNQLASSPVSQFASILSQPLPHLQKQFISKQLDSQMQILIDLVSTLRNIRAQWKIEPTQLINVVIKPKDKKCANILEENIEYVKLLAKVKKISINLEAKRPEKSAFSIITNADIFVPLEGVIDIQKEKTNIINKINEINNFLSSLEKRLKNKDFLKKAPAQVVEKEKSRAVEFKDSLKRLNSMLKELD